jgi:hypothetical protein
MGLGETMMKTYCSFLSYTFIFFRNNIYTIVGLQALSLSTVTTMMSRLKRTPSGDQVAVSIDDAVHCYHSTIILLVFYPIQERCLACENH